MNRWDWKSKIFFRLKMHLKKSVHDSWQIFRATGSSLISMCTCSFILSHFFLQIFSDAYFESFTDQKQKRIFLLIPVFQFVLSVYMAFFQSEIERRKILLTLMITNSKTLLFLCFDFFYTYSLFSIKTFKEK